MKPVFKCILSAVMILLLRPDCVSASYFDAPSIIVSKDDYHPIWDDTVLNTSYTMRFAVCPVPVSTEYVHDVAVNYCRFPKKAVTTAVKNGTVYQHGSDIQVYDENNICTKEYHLLDTEFMISNNLDGWIDSDGHFIYITTIGEGHKLENEWILKDYRDGISINVFKEKHLFDSVEYVDGIMIVELTDTFARYNTRKYGEERPLITQDGTLLREQTKVFYENMDPAELKADVKGKITWVTPTGEIILVRKSTGDEGEEYTSEIYEMIMNGTYDFQNSAQDDGDTGSGLLTDSDGLMFVNADGSLARGWKIIGTDRYYFKKDGYAATGRATIGGIRYTFDENGVCKGRYTGWTKSSKGYRYYYKGKMLVGRYRIKGKTYDFDKNGHAALKPA